MHPALLEATQTLHEPVAPSNKKLLLAVKQIRCHGNRDLFIEACRHKREAAGIPLHNKCHWADLGS
jgi:hypothetical protein